MMYTEQDLRTEAVRHILSNLVMAECIPLSAVDLIVATLCECPGPLLGELLVLSTKQLGAFYRMRVFNWRN